MQGFNWDFEKEVLPNGITLWTLLVPWVNFTRFRVLFEMGFIDDPVGKEGLTHFLEHQLFNIPSKPRGKKRKMLTSWFSEQGCPLNANTSFDRILIEADILASRPDMFGAFWELITVPQVTVDYDAERRVIVEGEIAHGGKHEKLARLEQLQQIHLLGQGLGQFFHHSKTLGTVESMARIDGHDLEATWALLRQRCSHVIVVGKVSSEIKDRIGALPALVPQIRNIAINRPTAPIIEDTVSVKSFVGMDNWPVAVFKCKFALQFTDWREYACHRAVQEVVYDDLMQALRSELGCVYSVLVDRQDLMPNVCTYELNTSVAPEHIDKVRECFIRCFEQTIPKGIEKRLSLIKNQEAVFDPSVSEMVESLENDLQIMRTYCPDRVFENLNHSLTPDDLVAIWRDWYHNRYQLRVLVP